MKKVSMSVHQQDQVLAVAGLAAAVASESGLGSPLETAVALGVAAAYGAAAIIEEGRERTAAAQAAIRRDKL
jgi:hypothetical protein